MTLAGALQEQVSTLAGRRAHSYVLLGMIFRQQNKMSEARQALEKALQIAPKDATVFAQFVDLDLAGEKSSTQRSSA